MYPFEFFGWDHIDKDHPGLETVKILQGNKKLPFLIRKSGQSAL